MNDVKRWAPFPNDEPDFFVVAASDYDALAAENAALKADAERYRLLVKRNPTYFDDIDRQIANEANAVQPSDASR